MKIEELRNISEAATEKPWLIIDKEVTDKDNEWIICTDCSPEDKKLIAHARNHFDALLDVAEAAKNISFAESDSDDYDSLEIAIKKLDEL